MLLPMIISKLFKYILLVLAFTIIFASGTSLVLWFYSSKTVNASMICSHDLKYKILDEYVSSSDTYVVDIYLEKQNYSLQNLYQIFSRTVKNRPAHRKFEIFVYTDRKYIPPRLRPDEFSLSVLPLYGIDPWDAIYSSKEVNSSIEAIEYRPILWLPFYYRAITINIRDEN